MNNQRRFNNLRNSSKDDETFEKIKNRTAANNFNNSNFNSSYSNTDEELEQFDESLDQQQSTINDSKLEQELENSGNKEKDNKNTAKEAVFDLTRRAIDIILKIKIRNASILGFSIFFGICIFLVLVVFSFHNLDFSITRGNTTDYIEGNQDFDDIYDYLVYINVCGSEDSVSDCKKTAGGKFFIKFQKVVEDAKKACNNNFSKPCGVELNIPLMFETLSYYKTDKEMVTRENVLNDIDDLALGMSEWVKEICTKTYRNGKTEVLTHDQYYHISYNKYVSFLKFGTTSTHPNYSGQPLIVDRGDCDNLSAAVFPEANPIDNSNTEFEVPTDGSTRSEIVKYALQFVGNPYVYGGTSLTNGIDCSAFIMKVYENFGYSLPRTSEAQSTVGTSIDISEILPGDLIYYGGHIAIYIGNDQVVHASNSKPYPQGGIKVSKATYRTPLSIRRVIN